MSRKRPHAANAPGRRETRRTPETGAGSGARSGGRDHATFNLTDATRGIRIQKVLAAAGVASRRHCEDLILEGRVTVNGRQVTKLPAWVDPYADRIEVNGRLLPQPRPRSVHPRKHEAPSTSGARPAAPVQAGHLYVMLNKPRRVVSTGHDPEGRRTVTDLVQLEGADGPVRLFPVGRLDADSTGLILLTNDGDLTHRLTHASFGVPKTYLVSLKGNVAPEDLRRLERMLSPARQRDRRPAPAASAPSRTPSSGDRARGPGTTVGHAKGAIVEQAVLIGHQHDQSRGDRTNVRVTLNEGQNRGIRDLMVRLGLKVRRLQRIAVGPLRLKGLSSGHWRFLSHEEVGLLRRTAGL